MNVYWLEQTEADVPDGNDWLSGRELVFLESLRFPKRRADWRLGRWTAKRALAVCLASSDSPSTLAKMEVRPAASGAPEVFFENRVSAVAISLSHRNGRALCAVTGPGVELGCDLELIEPHTTAFVADYFTAGEQALLERQPAAGRPWLVALLWSAKESALKALHAGLRLDTRSVGVHLLDVSFELDGWRPMEVSYTGGQSFHGWWQNANDMLRTIVAAPPPASPIFLGKGDFRGGPNPFLWLDPIPAAKRCSSLPCGS